MCYVAPIAGAVISTAIWKKTRGVKVWWLTLMFYGGALFGAVDHLWNGELFLISENLGKDLLLGVVISLVILVSWGITSVYAKVNPTLASYVK